jgi:hypothetical protein
MAGGTGSRLGEQLPSDYELSRGFLRPSGRLRRGLYVSPGHDNSFTRRSKGNTMNNLLKGFAGALAAAAASIPFTPSIAQASVADAAAGPSEESERLETPARLSMEQQGKGRTGSERAGLALVIYLDECKTQALIGAMTAGAGAAGVCAVLSSAGAGVASVPCGVLAGVLTIGVGAIIAIDGLGGNQGIVIGYLLNPPLIGPVIPIIRHQ